MTFLCLDTGTRTVVQLNGKLQPYPNLTVHVNVVTEDGQMMARLQRPPCSQGGCLSTGVSAVAMSSVAFHHLDRLFVSDRGYMTGYILSKQRASRWIVDVIEEAYRSRQLPSLVNITVRYTRSRGSGSLERDARPVCARDRRHSVLVKSHSHCRVCKFLSPKNW